MHVIVQHLKKNSGIGLSTLELFTFKHARAYRYARFGLSRFSRVHAHLQTRKWSELYRMFLLFDYRPLQLNYGVYLRGTWWPPIFVQGTQILVKLRFRLKVARSCEHVCRDRVRVLCAYVRGVLLHSQPPLGGAPTRFRSRISVEEYSTEDHTIPSLSFFTRCLGNGV